MDPRHQEFGGREVRSVQSSGYREVSTKFRAPGTWHRYHISYLSRLRGNHSDASPCSNVLCANFSNLKLSFLIAGKA